MAKIWYGHFDSTQEDPRELLAEDWAKYISMFLGNGIRNGGTNLQITADGAGMYTKMDEGYANINGYFFKSESDIEGGRYYTIAHPAANPELPRIDRIVLRLDRTIAVRQIVPAVITGSPSLSPTAPQLTRNNNIYEISLAQIRVPAGAAVIRPADITDERLNSNLCGIIDSLISADTAEMYQDFTDKFLEKMNFYEVSFENQLQAQGKEFEITLTSRKNDFDYWFGSAKTDIAMLQTYDFDNLAALSQVDKTTEFLEDGNIKETIRKKLDNILVAERHTVFNEDESISATVTVYQEDGETIKNQSTVNTVFEAYGNIREEVVS